MIDKPISRVIEKYPFMEEYLEQNKLYFPNKLDLSLEEILNSLDETYLEDNIVDISKAKDDFQFYLESMKNFLGLEEEEAVESLTLLAGFDKDGLRENYSEIVLNKSDIIAIVGPTGAGKSRLLADIEWAANGDTPTKRKILINGRPMDPASRYDINTKLVAQLSQNMNFIMDLSVGEFIELHGESRKIDGIEPIKEKILQEANRLAGESFTMDTPITSLSGGQSRALMIADTAILSKSPIVLIDEIENAGIDRKKALDLLLEEDKIVLMSTHDPILALMANKRIVIKNGGISNIINTTDEEKKLLLELEKVDEKTKKLREALRNGERL